ncbi:uncharacterized protein ZBAI_01801 [Zygosaccharomyces bailii ISA1307]|nr:uncharacterized protein ZBAI_01801 [Zygosaccharomyces bailii ISA1307]
MVIRIDNGFNMIDLTQVLEKNSSKSCKEYCTRGEGSDVNTNGSLNLNDYASSFVNTKASTNASANGCTQASTKANTNSSIAVISNVSTNASTVSINTGSNARINASTKGNVSAGGNVGSDKNHTLRCINKWQLGEKGVAREKEAENAI